MKILEIRRHSWRKDDGGSQLSQAGVDLARRVGADLGPFRKVTATVSPRTRETAVAMGFAVDHELVPFADQPDALDDPEPWYTVQEPYAALAAVVRRHERHRRFADALVRLWQDLLEPFDDGDAALYIGHGQELELGLLAAFPTADHATWGATIAPCEGATLTFDGEPGWFRTVEFHRIDDPAPGPPTASSDD